MTRKNQKIVVGIGFLLLILFGVFRNSNEEYELRKYGRIAEAKIINYGYASGASSFIDYVFYVNGEKYFGTRKVSSFKCDDGKKGCVGEKFKVIYSSRNPEISEIDLGIYNDKKLSKPSIDFSQFK
ncbi:MAG: hypothetical protein ACON5F_06530 [Jejuia sp.]